MTSFEPVRDEGALGRYAGRPHDSRRVAPPAARRCPGLPGHPPGACPNPPESGDRYCAGCRAEFDSQPEDGGW